MVLDFEFVWRSEVKGRIRGPLRSHAQLPDHGRAYQPLGHPNHRGIGKRSRQVQGKMNNMTYSKFKGWSNILFFFRAELFW